MREKNQKNAQNDVTDAIRHRAEQRDEYKEPQKEETKHEEKDLSYVDENKITVGLIVKYIAIALIILIFAILIYRIASQKKMYNEDFIWTNEALSVYKETGKLTVWVQEMSSYRVTTKFDEEYNPIDSIEFVYAPYSNPNPNLKNEDFEGSFMIGYPMYIEETKQLIVTFRVNRTAKKALMEHYSLDYEPTGDVYRFLLSDGKNAYTDYEYITFSKNSYYYYRLVFNGVTYDNLTGYKDINQSQITELDLSVFFKYKFNENSPIVTMTVANSYCPIEEFDIDDALPAALTPDLKASPEWEKEKESDSE